MSLKKIFALSVATLSITGVALLAQAATFGTGDSNDSWSYGYGTGNTSAFSQLTDNVATPVSSIYYNGTKITNTGVVHSTPSYARLSFGNISVSSGVTFSTSASNYVHSVNK